MWEVGTIVVLFLGVSAGVTALARRTTARWERERAAARASRQRTGGRPLPAVRPGEPARRGYRARWLLRHGVSSRAPSSVVPRPPRPLAERIRRRRGDRNRRSATSEGPAGPAGPAG
jgi:hypothetical protein